VKQYGETLKEYGTDISMAKSILAALKRYLFFHPHDISQKEFEDICSKRKSCSD